VIERVIAGEIKRLIITMPPRHGKSELISRLLPAYFLLRNPAKSVSIASYSFSLAQTLARAARDNFVNTGGRIKEDAGAIAHWQTSSGGGCWSVGVGGSLTGKGAHLMLLDDPIKDSEEASSLAMRDKLFEWYGSTFYTRQEPNAAIVIIQTRWHEDDLTGRLLAAEYSSRDAEHWHIVSLPALYESDHHDLFPPSCSVEPDFRNEEGEALCPERYPVRRLLHTKSQIGGYSWDALYMQRPTSPSGVLFDVTKLQVVDAGPREVKTRVRAWDKAATPGGGDWTAGVRLSKTSEGIYYIEDVCRGQWNTADRDRMIRFTAEFVDGEKVKIYGEQEPGSAGVSDAAAFVRLLSGFAVKTERASGSKEIRADGFSAQVNAGNVRLIRGDWNKDFVEEMRQFPRGKHDDQVDAASLAFNQAVNVQQWRFYRGLYELGPEIST